MRTIKGRKAKHYVDADGVYLGGFDGVAPPAGAVQVPSAPGDARQTWSFGSGDWSAAPAPVPAEITPMQLRVQGAAAGWISEAEAEAWQDSGALPGVVQGVIDALPAAERFAARMRVKGMTVVERSNPLLAAVAAAGIAARDGGAPDADAVQAELDDFFRAAALI
jgi:hypothetical protein